MKCFYLTLLLLYGFVLSPFTLGSQEISTSNANSQQDDKIVQWALTHLPQTGVLTEGKNGFVYLKVSDDYINQLFPQLSYEGYEKPPFFRRPDSPGAHISVIYVEERNKVGKIDEIGQTFPFKVINIALVPPKSKKYVVLVVDSPELQALRKKYGLSPLLKNHPFHISIAEKNRRSSRHKYH